MRNSKIFFQIKTSVLEGTMSFKLNVKKVSVYTF